jgi:hypothetical protein
VRETLSQVSGRFNIVPMTKKTPITRESSDWATAWAEA